jgi:methionyl-tRNA formyltransferase
MRKISHKIVFFGTDEFSFEALSALMKADYNVCAVVTKPDSKSGRGQKLNQSIVKQLAIKSNIPVWQPAKLSDIQPDIKKLGKDAVGVLASYGRIIPESIINLFYPGIINIHPSLLPVYRGPTPIESAIANGDNETGVSIMKLVSSMDSGPIYDQVKYKLSGNETQPELYKVLAKIGADLLIKVLPDILGNKLNPVEQNNSQASYCSTLNKQDSFLNLSNLSSPSAERLIRAHLTFPRTKIDVLGNTIIITKAHISEEECSPIDILCIDNKYLAIDELVAPSGKKMNAKDFINGYKLA